MPGFAPSLKPRHRRGENTNWCHRVLWTSFRCDCKYDRIDICPDGGTWQNHLKTMTTFSPNITGTLPCLSLFVWRGSSAGVLTRVLKKGLNVEVAPTADYQRNNLGDANIEICLWGTFRRHLFFLQEHLGEENKREIFMKNEGQTP